MNLSSDDVSETYSILTIASCVDFSEMGYLGNWISGIRMSWTTKAVANGKKREQNEFLLLFYYCFVELVVMSLVRDEKLNKAFRCGSKKQMLFFRNLQESMLQVRGEQNSKMETTEGLLEQVRNTLAHNSVSLLRRE